MPVNTAPQAQFFTNIYPERQLLQAQSCSCKWPGLQLSARTFVGHTVTRDPITLPTETGTTRHFLLSISFLFSRPHATPFSSSSSGNLDHFMMATGHPIPDPP